MTRTSVNLKVGLFIFHIAENHLHIVRNAKIMFFVTVRSPNVNTGLNNLQRHWSILA
jgi:hypothetical protein